MTQTTKTHYQDSIQARYAKYMLALSHKEGDGYGIAFWLEQYQASQGHGEWTSLESAAEMMEVLKLEEKDLPLEVLAKIYAAEIQVRLLDAIDAWTSENDERMKAANAYEEGTQLFSLIDTHLNGTCAAALGREFDRTFKK